MSSMIPSVERFVAVFWDLDASQLQDSDFSDTSHFAGHILEIAKSYSSSGYIDSSKIYPKSEVEEPLAQVLGDNGFEIMSTTAERGENSLYTDILFWLWDSERARQSSSSHLPCLIVITTSNEHVTMLNNLRNRSVYVVCVSNFLDNGNPVNHELRKCCSTSLDFSEVPSRGITAREKLANSHMPQSQEAADVVNRCGQSGEGSVRSSTPATAPPPQFPQQQSSSLSTVSSRGGFAADDHWTIFTSRSSSSDVNDHQMAGLVSSKEVQQQLRRPESEDSGEVLSNEQRQLHDELVSAVYAYNVKEAVTTLRKIYNKQTRCFRIHTVLAVVLPDTAAMIADGRNDLLCVAVSFALDCIRWTLGVQKGENIESFKYKMNLNIARWILRETVRKGIPDPPPSEISATVVDLVDHILESVVEPEFAWELLTSLQVSQPVQRLVPYLLNWKGSRDPAVEARLNDFLYDHKEFSSVIPPSQPQYPSHVAQYRGGGDPGASMGGGSSLMGPGYGQSARAGGPPSHTSSHQASGLDDLSLEGRLLKLLARSTKGELGARIPALYRDEFGEPLRLRGRKLKDILLDTGNVEMIGSEGPGDKLFRLISRGGGGGGGGMGGAPPMRAPISAMPPTASRSQGSSYSGHGGSYSGYRLSSPGSDDSRYQPYGMTKAGVAMSSDELRSRSEDAYFHKLMSQQQSQSGETRHYSHLSGATGSAWDGIAKSDPMSSVRVDDPGLFGGLLGGTALDNQAGLAPRYDTGGRFYGGGERRSLQEENDDNAFLYRLHENFE